MLVEGYTISASVKPDYFEWLDLPDCLNRLFPSLSLVIKVLIV